MSITIEGLPADVVRRRKERIEEIDAELVELHSERLTLVRIVQKIDGEEEGSRFQLPDSKPERAAEEPDAEDLPANDPAPERVGRKRIPLRRLVDQVLSDGCRRTRSDLLSEVNRRLRGEGLLAINSPDLEAVLRAGLTSGRLSEGADGYALVEQLAEVG